MKNLLQKSKKAIKEGSMSLLVFAKVWSVINRTPVKRFFNSELKGFKQYIKFYRGKIGLEIGGPSGIFSSAGALPIYNYAERIDGCNFSDHTIWEGSISQGLTYKYSNQKIGNQFICEGSQLDGLPDHNYDFIISSHSIEHFANPLKAVKEWLRVLKPGGVLLVVAPDKRFTFDHRRQVTSFSHILNDYVSGVGEDDLTHLKEILSLHDLLLDPGAGTLPEFIERSRKNYENRSFHQHVFDKALLKRMLDYCGVEVLYADFALPFNIIVMGRVIV